MMGTGGVSGVVRSLSAPRIPNINPGQYLSLDGTQPPPLYLFPTTILGISHRKEYNGLGSMRSHRQKSPGIGLDGVPAGG